MLKREEQQQQRQYLPVHVLAARSICTDNIKGGIARDWIKIERVLV